MSDLGELRQLEESLGAVRAVGAVVSAVSALARAQLPRAEEAVAQTETYLAWLERVVDELAGPPLESAEPVFHVVLGPERAFCGDLADEMLAAAPVGVPIGVVGQRVTEAAQRRGELDLRFALPGPAGVDDIEGVSRALARAVLDTGPDADVELVHPAQRGAGVARTRILVTRRGPAPGGRDLFSPPERIAEAALRESVTGHLRGALAETLLVETRVRAGVADRARRAVNDREARLVSQLRVLERELVTAEVTELTAAMEALADRPLGA